MTLKASKALYYIDLTTSNILLDRKALYYKGCRAHTHYGNPTSVRNRLSEIVSRAFRVQQYFSRVTTK